LDLRILGLQASDGFERNQFGRREIDLRERHERVIDNAEGGRKWRGGRETVVLIKMEGEGICLR